MWIALDLLTILCSACLAILYRFHFGALMKPERLWNGACMRGDVFGMFVAVLAGFAVVLILTSRNLGLYRPDRLNNMLHEQRLSVQACLLSGLLLAGSLYMLRAQAVPRSLTVLTVALVTVFLSVRRIGYNLLRYRRFARGVGLRNVLIIGSGPEAHALRHHLVSIPRLGYAFKGFINATALDEVGKGDPEAASEALEAIFQQARKLFVDEILLTSQCARGVVQKLLEQARANGVDLRVIPYLYDGLAWSAPVEYIGQFPTIPLHAGHVPVLALAFKRVMDIVIALGAILLLLPIELAVALAIKLDSSGPVFYSSERVGKKGRIFHCTKFRTMVVDAEKRRASLMDQNERDGVLFKITDDPRITRIGRILRKYSVDELPQFFNVLRGEMSVVGPRPPLASEVKQYEIDHLRRLDVTPGITGLWQVEARQDPSFASYVSMDLAYIEKWSLWLDFKIILRTIGVVFAGTGS